MDSKYHVAAIHPMAVWRLAWPEDAGRLVRFKKSPDSTWVYGLLDGVKAPTEYTPRLYMCRMHEAGFGEYAPICEVQDMDAVSYAVFKHVDGATHTVMSFNGKPCCQVVAKHRTAYSVEQTKYVFNYRNATKSMWRKLGGKTAGIKKHVPPKKGFYYVTTDPDLALSLCRQLYNMDYQLQTGVPG